MNLSINQTIPGTVRYPLHSHGFWEIMYYVEGTGHLATPDVNYPFQPGSIIIVPPGVLHGSVSMDGFRNICVGGSFEHLFLFDSPCPLSDNEDREGKMLVQAILRNQHGNQEYLNSLCTAYVQFLLQNIRFDSDSAKVIRSIVSRIEESFTDPEADVTVLLRESGYSEDYIRSRFRQITGKTPVEMLTQLRIDHAKNMLDIYGRELSVTQIGTRCGFTDPVYFSKRFKALVGISPADYRRKFLP